MATSGCGQGLTGSVETKDLHLQRGVAEVVEDVDYGEDDFESENNSNRITVTSRTQVVLTVIESNGKIHTLK